jgi:hypothetical protein
MLLFHPAFKNTQKNKKHPVPLPGILRLWNVAFAKTPQKTILSGTLIRWSK